MFFRYGFRYGKAKTIMMPVAAAGLIDSVEAVKEVLQLLRRDLIPIIDCAEYRRMTLMFQ